MSQEDDVLSDLSEVVRATFNVKEIKLTSSTSTFLRGLAAGMSFFSTVWWGSMRTMLAQTPPLEDIIGQSLFQNPHYLVYISYIYIAILILLLSLYLVIVYIILVSCWTWEHPPPFWVVKSSIFFKTIFAIVGVHSCTVPALRLPQDVRWPDLQLWSRNCACRGAQKSCSILGGEEAVILPNLTYA